MSKEQMENADTEPPPPEEAVPNADAPCDASGCTKTWSRRVEWYGDDGELVVRFACPRHEYLYLMSARERLPKH